MIGVQHIDESGECQMRGLAIGQGTITHCQFHDITGGINDGGTSRRRWHILEQRGKNVPRCGHALIPRQGLNHIGARVDEFSYRDTIATHVQ